MQSPRRSPHAAFRQRGGTGFGRTEQREASLTGWNGYRLLAFWVRRTSAREALCREPATEPQLRPGTVLVREHGGKRHTVTVTHDGFVWQDRTYPSLSAVVRTITGTSWNGRRFFGLRMKRKADRAEAGR
jgi:Protein of unknown function (DUF2924)